MRDSLIIFEMGGNLRCSRCVLDASSRTYSGLLAACGCTVKLSFEFLSECPGLRAIDKDRLDSNTEEVSFDVI